MTPTEERPAVVDIMKEQVRDANKRIAQFRADGGVLTPVPNKPKTPLRSFRIPDDLYEKAQERAAEKGESVSDVVRRALERYVRSKR